MVKEKLLKELEQSVRDLFYMIICQSRVDYLATMKISTNVSSRMIISQHQDRSSHRIRKKREEMFEISFEHFQLLQDQRSQQKRKNRIHVTHHRDESCSCSFRHRTSLAFFARRALSFSSDGDSQKSLY